MMTFTILSGAEVVLAQTTQRANDLAANTLDRKIEVCYAYNSLRLIIVGRVRPDKS